MRNSRWLIAALIVTAITALVLVEPGRYLTLDYLKSERAVLEAYVAAYPLRASLICFGIYVAATALSVPGAIVMTLAVGAVFGLIWGAVIVSFASSLGATLAFLLARYLLKEFVQSRYGHRLGAVNRGIKNDGPVYLLTLRLILIVPYVAVNLLMALTPISTRNFYLFSQLGMLPATLVYVNAGTQIARIQSPGDIVSAPLILSFMLLGVFPFLAKFLVALFQRRRFRAQYPPPPQVDRNVIVIGAGSAGLIAAYIASAVKAKVTLIERERMGGDCLNTGCVPSKALLRAAKQVHSARASEALGIKRMHVEFEFSEIMARVQEVIQTIEPHDSVERYTGLGVECISGDARIVSPYTVAVNGREISARAIILATGASPLVPPINGLDQIEFLTSETVWDLRELPRQLLIIGGGPIGCELAQAFARFGARVTLVEMAARLLPAEDEEVSQLIQDVFKSEAIDVRLGHRAERFERDGDRCSLWAASESASTRIEFDEVVLALGRKANVEGYGLEELGVPVSEQGTIEVNDYLQTKLPTVFACGDVASPYQFTHMASHQAWYAAVNALFGDLKRLHVDYRVVPWCTFTDPEIAHLSLNEDEARAQNRKFETTVYQLADLDRAITDGATRGFVKVLTAPGSDRILGATIVGDHAGDLLSEFVLAMKHHLGLKKILGTIHTYPTLAEANKLTAGSWRRAHTSPRILNLLEKYHRWRRGD